jgi:hypothetical protein
VPPTLASVAEPPRTMSAPPVNNAGSLQPEGANSQAAAEVEEEEFL